MNFLRFICASWYLTCCAVVQCVAMKMSLRPIGSGCAGSAAEAGSKLGGRGTLPPVRNMLPEPRRIGPDTGTRGHHTHRHALLRDAEGKVDDGVRTAGHAFRRQHRLQHVQRRPLRQRRIEPHVQRCRGPDVEQLLLEPLRIGKLQQVGAKRSGSSRNSFKCRMILLGNVSRAIEFSSGSGSTHGEVPRSLSCRTIQASA